MSIFNNSISIKTKLNELFNAGEYKKALDLAVKHRITNTDNVDLLKMLARIFEKNDKLDEAKNFLIKALNKTEDKANIQKQLIRIAIECKDLELAKDTLVEFRNSNIKDVEVDYLEYLISRATNYNIEKSIIMLEKIQKTYYKQEWMYELALEYEKAGYIDKCILQCEELDLWFKDGEYVVKGIKLKSKYKPLTPLEKNKIDTYDALSYEFDNSKLKEDKKTDLTATNNDDIVDRFLRGFEEDNKVIDEIFNEVEVSKDESFLEPFDVLNVDNELIENNFYDEISNDINDEEVSQSIDNDVDTNDYSSTINQEDENLSIQEDIIADIKYDEELEEDYDLTQQELEEILAGDAEYEQEQKQILALQESDKINKVKKLVDIVSELDNEKLFVGNKKYVIIKGVNKKLVEEFITTYSKHRARIKSKQVSTINALNLNKADMKDIYSKISNRYLIVHDSEKISEQICSNIVESANFNNNVIIFFTTDSMYEIDAINSHLLEKMIALDIKISNEFNEYITYAILYAAINGAILTEYAIDAIQINLDEIFSKDKSYLPIEKVLDLAIENYNYKYLSVDFKYKNITDDEVVYAIQELMDKNII